MKVLVILAAAAAVALARPGDLYDDSKSNLDIDELVSNERLLKGYAHCFLETGPCTPEGNNIKKIIPEALENVCKKCTPKQRVMVRKMIAAFKEKLPAEWSELAKTYDSEGKYKENVKTFLAQSD
ncbi:hypothetical protein JYU34_014493 [Plutella xylostella]|uniref:Chemosensory protein n=1 Tax=Plutella xylostella TaxID=51655 RepID=A0ABQ7Q8F5_PLUXY|nr:hypothetical protein JYU34_014493 [Plutella xylostella]